MSADLNRQNQLLLLPTEIFQLFLIFFGTVGNVFVIYIVRIKTKGSAKVFLVGMAVVDLFTSLLMIPCQIYQFSVQYSFHDLVFCRFFEWLRYGIITSSCFVLHLVALDRYVAICKPHHWNKITPQRAKLALSFVIGLGFALTSPEVVLSGIQTTPLVKDSYAMAILDSAGVIIETMPNNSDMAFTHKCEHLDAYDGPALRVYGSLMFAIFLGNAISIMTLYTFVWRTMSDRKMKWSCARKAFKVKIQPLEQSFGQPSSSSDVKCACETDRITLRLHAKKNIPMHDSVNSKDTAQQIANRDQMVKVDSSRNTESSEHIYNPRNSPCGHQERLHWSIPNSSSRSVVPSSGSYSVSSLKTVANPATNKARYASVDSMHRQMKMTKLFLYVTIAFMLPWIPFWCLNIGWMVNSTFQFPSPLGALMLLNFVFYLFYLNCAINPVIYIACNKEMRDEGKRMLRKIQIGRH